MMIIIGITSLPTVRQKNYKLFYIIHVVLSLVVLPVAWFHVIYLRYYVAGAVLIVLYDKFSRLYQSTWTVGKLAKIDDRTTEVVVDYHKKVTSPGLHMVLTVPTISLLRHHPFTIESTVTDHKMRFVVQKRDGFTKQLADQPFNSDKLQMILDGPFGAAGTFPPFKNFEQVVFISGGVGATFTLPLWLHMHNTSSAKNNKPKTRFIWSVKSLQDMQWAIDELTTVPKCQIQIHVTQTSQKPDSSSSSMESKEDIELTDNEVSRQRLLSANDDDGEDDNDDSKGTLDSNDRMTSMDELKEQLPSATVSLGRPNLMELLNETTLLSKKGNVAVLVCGPIGLNQSVKAVIEKYREPERVWFWSESFGW